MNKKHSQIWHELHSHESVIFGYIKDAVQDAEVARDLCQDVFIQALYRIDELDPEKNLYHWLKVVSRNRVINYFRERKRRTFLELTENTIRTELNIENLTQSIEKVIQMLPSDQRNVFIMRELEGYSYRELAEYFGRSEAAITSLLKRARNNFSRLYLIQHLPEWFRKISSDLSIEDIGRFINTFDPPLDLLDEIQRKSQKYFGRVRHKWDEIHKKLFPRSYLDQIIKILGPDENKRVLDMGCGSGVVAARNAALGKQVFGLDINKMMLSDLVLLKNTMHLKNLQLIRCNLNFTPLKPAMFDEIFLTLVLHHISDPKKLIARSAELLNIKGKMIIVEFNRHTDKQMADTMHDLWLGFEPELLERWCKKLDMNVIGAGNWKVSDKVGAYYRIFQKH